MKNLQEKLSEKELMVILGGASSDYIAPLKVFRKRYSPIYFPAGIMANPLSI